MVQEQNPFKVAEVEVSYKSNYNITERSKINSSQDAYRSFKNSARHPKSYGHLH